MTTATKKRLESMRANLARLESNAAAIMSKGDNMTTEDRKNLLQFVNVAFHESGKIESIYSIDGSVTCEFCAKMRAAAEDAPLMICGACYAAKDSWKEAAFRRHKLNMRILSTVLFTAEELKALIIPEGANLRINEDGDIATVTHARNVLRIIESNKSAGVGFWFKNTPAVGDALKAEGVNNVAEKRARYGNARFVQSSVLIGFPARPAWFTDVVFTVFPDKETTLAAIAEGAFECNGRKCKECGFNCYNARKNGDGVQHVAEYLRTNNANRAAIMTAYNAKKSEV